MAAIIGDDRTKSEPMPNAAQDVASHDDEIDLMGYFVLFWRHKYLIITGSILPTLVIGLVLFFGPRQYQLTYTYSNWKLDDKNFEMFLDGFYSGENLDRIARRLKDKGFHEYAASIAGGGRKAIQGLILFEVWPPLDQLAGGWRL